VAEAQVFRRWLKDFAMLDVFALSCVVVLTAVRLGVGDMCRGGERKVIREVAGR